MVLFLSDYSEIGPDGTSHRALFLIKYSDLLPFSLAIFIWDRYIPNDS